MQMRVGGIEVRIVVGICLAWAAAGACQAQAIVVDVPAAVVVAPLPTEAKPKAVSLTRIAANIAPGTMWLDEQMSPYYMVPCVGGGDKTAWKESNNKISNLETFDRVFREELSKANFRTGGDSTNLFEEQQTADLQVGALLTDIRMRTCRFVSLVNSSYSGKISMDVEWQIYSVSQGRILGRIKTHGGIEQKDGKEQNFFGGMISSAFGDNTRRLAATDEFRRIVTEPVTKAPAPPAPLPFVAPSGDLPISIAVKGVVSIFAGDAMGSGVVISSDGYVLTNHHVVGSSGQVRIHWANGADSVGEVVRSDPRRDVALVRVAPHADPLPIRHTPAQLGETVFAVGTPLDKALANTVTQGVVSGTRLLEGQPFIQSDVAVTHGNSGGPLLDSKGHVIGLTDLGLAPNGTPIGLNFFIPIDDALRALSLTPQAPPVAASPPAKSSLTAKR